MDGPLPGTAHDVRMDVTATPKGAIACPRAARPPGILLLAAMARERSR